MSNKTWQDEESRSREGAWIEISQALNIQKMATCRSREGAWIEIFPAYYSRPYKQRRSREGAWIEISIVLRILFSFLCRSREGAWIEISMYLISSFWLTVAPARERGLKFPSLTLLRGESRSLPRGSVD